MTDASIYLYLYLVGWTATATATETGTGTGCVWLVYISVLRFEWEKNVGKINKSSASRGENARRKWSGVEWIGPKKTENKTQTETEAETENKRGPWGKLWVQRSNAHQRTWKIMRLPFKTKNKRGEKREGDALYLYLYLYLLRVQERVPVCIFFVFRGIFIAGCIFRWLVCLVFEATQHRSAQHSTHRYARRHSHAMLQVGTGFSFGL